MYKVCLMAVSDEPFVLVSFSNEYFDISIQNAGHKQKDYNNKCSEWLS